MHWDFKTGRRRHKHVLDENMRHHFAWWCSHQTGLLLLGFFYDQYRSIADVRYACVRCDRNSYGRLCSLLVVSSAIKEGWYRLVERVSEYTASRIRTKRGQFYLSGYRFIQQSTTNLKKMMSMALVFLIDDGIGSFSTRTYDETGTLYLFQKDRIQNGTVLLMRSTRSVTVCMCCFGSYEVF